MGREIQRVKPGWEHSKYTEESALFSGNGRDC